MKWFMHGRTGQFFLGAEPSLVWGAAGPSPSPDSYSYGFTYKISMLDVNLSLIWSALTDPIEGRLKKHFRFLFLNKNAF